MIPYHYIENQQQLENCCHYLVKYTTIAVDTEFVRERTFYSQPGLIQVSGGNQIYLIDPVICENLQSFFTLLESEELAIIMHSGSEDIELFYSMGCDTIQNLFDTQIAASWLGMGQSLSLQKLVEYYEKIKIEKQQTRTDWLKRPLSEAQLHYAATDVLYLNNIYQQQKKVLFNADYLDYMQQDCDLLCEKKSSSLDQQAYLKVKRAITTSGDSLLRLQALSSWREQKARLDNKPRQHIIEDEQLVQISLEFPQTIDQLSSRCSIHPAKIRRYGKEIVDVILKQTRLEQEPQPVLSLRSLVNGGNTLNDCRALLTTLQEQSGIPREVLPSKRWLEQFLLHYVADWYPQPVGWSGWRKELLEEPIRQLIKKNEFKKISSG